MSLIKKIDNIYGKFCIGMVGYGFYRGYNIENSTFYTEKIIKGVLNGGYYGFPFINMFPTIRLLNRLEISYKNLDKYQHKSEYEELFGYCYHTL